MIEERLPGSLCRAGRLSLLVPAALNLPWFGMKILGPMSARSAILAGVAATWQPPITLTPRSTTKCNQLTSFQGRQPVSWATPPTISGTRRNWHAAHQTKNGLCASSTHNASFIAQGRCAVEAECQSERPRIATTARESEPTSMVAGWFPMVTDTIKGRPLAVELKAASMHCRAALIWQHFPGRFSNASSRSTSSGDQSSAASGTNACHRIEVRCAPAWAASWWARSSPATFIAGTDSAVLNSSATSLASSRMPVG